MASILKVDEMQGVTAADQITITADASVTMTLQEGVLKHWTNIDGTGTISTRDSLNQSSISDQATGVYKSFFTSSLSSTDNVCACTNGHRAEDQAIGTRQGNMTTGRVGYQSHEHTSTTDEDTDSVFGMTVGVLA